MDELESRRTNPGGEGMKKRAAVSTDVEHLSKAARTDAPSDTRRLEAILVPRRQSSEDEAVEVELLMRARDVRGSADLPLVWERPDAIAYARHMSKSLDRRSYGSRPSHGRASEVT